MTYGSLFAGIGGLDLGLDRAGMTCSWQVEIDPFCRQVLTKHWPDVPKYGDVRDVGAHNLEPVDLICGGFPCQDIASAGGRLGLAGERSGLWSEMWRIVCELRPRYVLVENVADLLSGPDGSGEWFGVLLRDMAQGGYDAEWNCLPAGAFGAPHQRHRVFVVANSRDQPNLQTITDVDSIRKVRNARHDDGRGTWGGKPRTHGQESPPEVLGVGDGLPDWMVGANMALGNAVVPQVAEWVGRRIMETA